MRSLSTTVGCMELDGRDGPLWERLYGLAADVTRHAYAPYSGLKVGAAAVSSDGVFLQGCNVESASYGLTLCAEVGPLAALVAQGGSQFTHVAILSADGRELLSCGRWRQLLYEFSTEDCLINRVWRVRDLLPEAFSDKDLLSQEASESGQQ